MKVFYFVRAVKSRSPNTVRLFALSFSDKMKFSNLFLAQRELFDVDSVIIWKLIFSLVLLHLLFSFRVLLYVSCMLLSYLFRSSSCWYVELVEASLFYFIRSLKRAGACIMLFALIIIVCIFSSPILNIRRKHCQTFD